ncbi:uncharacterized protein BDV17DRAFT_294640 [Aspergillus undulatus]|uniref:uncharacterized protein n=1 Tax=Aspergillus undulatus TaxID=1810928 RepID=UPI003CCDE072
MSRLLAEHPRKPWYRDAGALNLYFVLFPGVLIVSATTGYEGSMLNGLQALTTFKDMNPVALQNIGWRYYIFYVVWLAVDFAIVFFTFPETLGYALEVTAVLDNSPSLRYKHPSKRPPKSLPRLDEETVSSDQVVNVPSTKV